MTPTSSPSIEHFFRGAFSIDMALFSFFDEHLHVLIEKKTDIGEGIIGLPGKLIAPDHDTDDAMDEMMRSLIKTDRFYKKQLQAFSAVDRHPAGRVISFTYYGLIQLKDLSEELPPTLSWYKLDEIPKLGFDHNDILKKVIKRFRKGLLRHPIVFELLPEEFILPDIITIYEEVFDQTLDKANFRKQILKSDMVIPLGTFDREEGRLGRPSQIHRFNREAYKGGKERVHFNFQTG
jgi:8-oxo-dGTP diphosphatase